MPKFDVTAPDGQKFEVNAPAGATESDAIAYVQRQFYGPKQVDMPVPAKPVGEKMNDAIGSTSLGEIGRQLGLTARYGIQGVGDVLDTLSSPIRAGLNMAGMNIQGRSGEGLADSLGLPKPQGTLENTIGKASELMAGGAIPIGLASKAAQGTQGVTQAVLKQVAANPLAQTVSNAGAGAAGEYVKQEGGNEKAQLLATLGGGLLAPAALAGGQKAVSAVQNMASKPAQQQAIDLTIKNIIDNGDYGVKFADVSGNVKAQLRKDLGDALSAGGQLDSDAARRLVDYRMVGATPTKGTLTLDPIQITREKNLAKIGANSTDTSLQGLANTQNRNNTALISNLNDLGANTADTAYDAGKKIIGALDSTDAKWRQAIGQRYEAARATDGRAAMIDPSAFTQSANNALDDALLGGKLPADVRNLMNKIALGPDVEGGIPLTVDVAEQFKTRIGDLQRATNDRAEKMALGLVRQSLDQAPLLPGQDIGQKSIDAFNNARRLNRTYMNAVDQNQALQAVREGVEPDKFVQNFIIGNGGKSNVSDVMALRSAVSGPVHNFV